ncbi:MAG: GNAT family N-acetyltransferase [Melioribacteraceae bacterium]|nr:GNAT family N-acetyltransferase [Melioribacteraceae bacterium]
MKITLLNCKNELHIESFHQFIAKIFPGVSFRKWHSNGFWNKNYTAFSFIEKDQIISNICCMWMKLFHNEKIINGVQIGAVGTLPEYRNKGLSRELLKYVKYFYKDNTDLFFLYANERVYDFYKKYDFKLVYEKIFIADANKLSSSAGYRKLNIENKNDYKFLIDSLKTSRPVTKIFGAYDYWYLTMWHVFNNYKNDLYYFDELKTVSLQKLVEDTLHIHEVFSSSPITLADIAIKNSTDKVKVYFPPDQVKYEVRKIDKEDTGLFVLGNIDLENLEFRFPPTAYT